MAAFLRVMGATTLMSAIFLAVAAIIMPSSWGETAGILVGSAAVLAAYVIANLIEMRWEDV